MDIYPRKQNFAARAAAWYLRDFPILRGRGLVNRLLGKFLQVEVFDSVKLRLINPLELHQKVLLFGESVYEPLETSLFRNVLRPGMVFFDIGANMGYYSLLASKRVAPHGSVHAFEPSPVQFNHLELNIRINRADNIVSNKCAVAESSGDRELFVSEGWNQGIHSLGKTHGQESSCRVPCVSIDDYVAKRSIKAVDAIKVDVEGAELFVFKGAERTLASSPPGLLLFEACEEFAQSFGYSTCDVKQTVEQYGYALYRLEDASQPVRISASSIERYANILAIHSSAEDWCYEALQSLYSAGNGRVAKSDE